ncbi:MAG: hypothetical protein E6529_06530 [[Ruminococcus] lactaris]|nr:hypothetical protein [[Ruminococcus] lactaris]MDU6470490.1 hypothetical protein [[Ruminococcus] lactaris]
MRFKINRAIIGRVTKKGFRKEQLGQSGLFGSPRGWQRECRV